MRFKSMLKRSVLIFSVLTLICVSLIPILPVQGEEEIYDRTLRLHVIANSDSEEDQWLKLQVRDRILELMSATFNEAQSREEAVMMVEDHYDELLRCAKNEIADKGFDYDVNITLTEEYYPTREYEGVSLPAGDYLSLRVLIGAAEGQNWWCVLFPPLCTSSAEPKEKLKAAGFTSPQIRVLTEGESPRYKLKFRFLEYFNKIF